jgi:hypothetical protein
MKVLDLFDNEIEIGSVVVYPVGQGGITYGLVTAMQLNQKTWRGTAKLSILKASGSKTTLTKHRDAVVLLPCQYNENVRKLVALYQETQSPVARAAEMLSDPNED